MDDLDKKILVALQTSARMKNVDLARELGIAPSTVMDRIRRLEDSGLIQGYRGIINPEMLGLTIQAFISVSLVRHEVDLIHEFEERIRQISHVRACYHLTGTFDYLLYVVAQNQQQLGELVKQWIASIPGIGKVETFLMLSEVKPDEGWPIEENVSLHTKNTDTIKNSSGNNTLKRRGKNAKKNDS
jgi:Lrp/AsnC family leucine-responsive transcriptional regulator